MNENLWIVILQRGWVMVGTLAEKGDMCELTDASVIRRWGTSRGLGELATGGPTADTVLDPAGTVQFHTLTTIARIHCDGAAWQR